MFLLVWLGTMFVSYFLFRYIYKTNSRIVDITLIFIFFMPFFNIIVLSLIALAVLDLKLENFLNKVFFIKK